MEGRCDRTGGGGGGGVCGCVCGWGGGGEGRVVWSYPTCLRFLNRALASPNTPSTHARRAEWSTFDSVLALCDDSLSNLIFCLNVSVSCSIGAGRGAFLSPSAPCTAARTARKPSRNCFAASFACANAGTSLPRLSCSSLCCFRNL